MKENNFLIIAVDGTAGSGKGTLARRLAAHYNLAHLDTGNIYRAVAKKILFQKIDLNNEQACADSARQFTFADTLAKDLQHEEITHAASVIAGLPSVRAALFDFQLQFALSPPSKKGAVLDGRDIGTVVYPQTPYKIYLTAKIETCALRRFKQLQEQQITSIYDRILWTMQERNQRDQERSVSPSKPASDAYIIDSTFLNADQAFEQACFYIDHRQIEKKRISTPVLCL